MIISRWGTVTTPSIRSKHSLINQPMPNWWRKRKQNWRTSLRSKRPSRTTSKRSRKNKSRYNSSTARTVYYLKKIPGEATDERRDEIFSFRCGGTTGFGHVLFAEEH